MCGIVGVINPITLAHEKWFENALIVDQLRGFHSTGAYAVTAKEVMWDKAAVIGTQFVQRPQFKAMLTGKLLALVGHNRWATQGDVVKANAHPFHHGDITLVHNGTLRTEAPGVKAEQFGTDSEGIAYSLSRDGAVAEDVLGELNGAFALVWHDLHDNCIRMIRNEDRPLWLAKCKLHDTILFASEPKMIEWLAERNKIELSGAPYQIQRGMLYRFDLAHTKDADRIKPYIKQVTLRPRYNYESRWNRVDWWEDEKTFPSRATANGGQTQTRNQPANIQPPVVTPITPRVRETTMLPDERDEFLAAHKFKINEDIVCSVLDVTGPDSNGYYRVDAVADLGTNPDIEDADVVVYNLLYRNIKLDNAAYVGGKIVNVRKVNGVPVIVLNPSTCWIADSDWHVLYDTIIKDVKKNTKKEEQAKTAEPTFHGPDRSKVTGEEWDRLTAGGCASCGTRFQRKEAELIEWIGQRPLCHHCSCDDEVVARTSVNH